LHFARQVCPQHVRTRYYRVSSCGNVSSRREPVTNVLRRLYFKVDQPTRNWKVKDRVWKKMSNRRLNGASHHGPGLPRILKSGGSVAWWRTSRNLRVW